MPRNTSNVERDTHNGVVFLVCDEQTSVLHRVWLREAARDQRRQSTPTEQRLWAVLRGRRINGWRFRRQHPIGPYIADFLCVEARVVVEIDGSIHDEQREYDAERDDYMTYLGFRVVRVTAENVAHDLPHVLSVIRAACETPPRSRTGEGVGG